MLTKCEFESFVSLNLFLAREKKEVYAEAKVSGTISNGNYDFDIELSDFQPIEYMTYIQKHEDIIRSHIEDYIDVIAEDDDYETTLTIELP